MRLGLKRIRPVTQATRIGGLSLSCLPAAFVFLNFSLPLSDPADGQALSGSQVRSSSFSDGGQIPARYTSDGGNVSPNLQGSPAPARTKTFAIVVNDPDAPIDFTHWLVYKIPPGIHGLFDEGSTKAAMPNGAQEGTNSFGHLGYSGPCPPAGKPHHYIFHLYALDSRLQLQAAAARNQLDSAIKGHIVSQGQVTGIYRRGIE
jgi:Raf kinase inhibitor-like YbhB/YbcL family protein